MWGFSSDYGTYTNKMPLRNFTGDLEELSSNSSEAIQWLNSLDVESSFLALSKLFGYPLFTVSFKNCHTFVHFWVVFVYIGLYCVILFVFYLYIFQILYI